MSFLCILGSFLKAKVQNVVYFLGLVKFQVFLGFLKFLIPDICFFFLCVFFLFVGGGG